MATALDIVQLDFCHIGDPPERQLVTSVLRLDRHGQRDDIPLFNGTIAEVGTWLQDRGYEYAPATKGVWVRPRP